MARMRR